MVAGVLGSEPQFSYKQAPGDLGAGVDGGEAQAAVSAVGALVRCSGVIVLPLCFDAVPGWLRSTVKTAPDCHGCGSINNSGLPARLTSTAGRFSLMFSDTVLVMGIFNECMVSSARLCFPILAFT
jgi:hypothetical protein